LKREIVAASLAPGSSASEVARRYDVNVNQLFLWRRHYRDEACGGGPPAFVPVTVAPDRPAAVAAPPAVSAGMIEIDLEAGYRLRVGGGVEAATLRLVLDVLEGR
jgi:transposase